MIGKALEPLNTSAAEILLSWQHLFMKRIHMKTNLLRSNAKVFVAACDLLLLLFVACPRFLEAQTNTFPASGNAGVGTTSPQNPLTIARSGSAPWTGRPAYELLQLVDRTNNTPQILFGSAFNGMFLRYTGTDGTATNQRLGIFTGGLVEVFVVNSNGYVGIGTTNPLYSLDVNGGTNGFRAKASTSSANDTIATFENASGIQAIVRANGNIGIGTTTPGYRLDVQGGSLNSSGGLCIAGDCKTAWSQVGSSQWTTGTDITNTNTGKVGITTHLEISKSQNAGTTVAVDNSYTTSGNAAYSGFWFRQGGINRFFFGANNDGNTTQSGGAGAVQVWSFVNAPMLFSTNNTERMRIAAGGNVGIGTTSPLQGLQIGSNTATATTTPDAVSLGASYSSVARANPKLRLFDNNAGSVYGIGVSSAQLDFMVPATARYVWSVNGTEKMRLDDSGNLTVSGNIAAKYQDVAEWVESSQALAAGTVVVLDHTKSNQVIACTHAYDTRVAGVISLQPGIILGESGAGKVLVAMTGRVKVKVDASAGPIQVGDLLVTSDKEGVARKSEPLSLGGVQIHRPGTLIGKALEPLDKGTGEILVLLSLQ
jgi:hypothetical protein